MTEPTREQLDALLDRAERHALSHAEAELLSATVRRLVEERDQHARAVQRVRDLLAYWTRVFPDNPAAPHIEETVTSVIDGRHVYIPGGDSRAWAGSPTFD